MNGTMTTKYGVFLCYNHHDKSAVKKIARRLRKKGIRPWFDEWELRPGQPWQKTIEQQIREIPTAAIFVGKDGLGPWEDLEMAATSTFTSRRLMRTTGPSRWWNSSYGTSD